MVTLPTRAVTACHSYMLQRGIKQSKSAVHEYAEKTLQNPRISPRTNQITQITYCVLCTAFQAIGEQFGFLRLQEFLILEVACF